MDRYSSERDKSYIQERVEISLHVPNDLCLLARLFGVLAIHHRSVLGWFFYSERERVTVTILAIEGDAVARGLKAAGFDYTSAPVLVLPYQLGRHSLAQLSTAIRTAGVSVLDVHACCSQETGPLVVLKTGDAEEARSILESMELPGTDATSGSAAENLQQLEAVTP